MRFFYLFIISALCSSELTGTGQSQGAGPTQPPNGGANDVLQTWLMKKILNLQDFKGPEDQSGQYKDGANKMVQLLELLNQVALRAAKNCRVTVNTDINLNVTVPEGDIPWTRALYRGHVHQMGRYAHFLIQMLKYIEKTCGAETTTGETRF